MQALNSSCIACTSKELVFFGNRNGYSYYRCINCGTLQLYPLPDTQSLAKAYEDEYSTAGHCQAAPEIRNKAAVPQFEAIVSALLAYTDPTLVLDYGCGWGGLLKVLKENHINAEGIEISTEMAHYCERQGYKILPNIFEDIKEEAVYSGIVLSSVFEHLLDHEMWFSQATRILKPDGIIVSLQPTAPFPSLLATLVRLGNKNIQLPQMHQIFCPPWHIALFSLAGMTAIAERNGFEVIEIRPAPLQQEKGFTGILQFLLSNLNKIATPIFGLKWPLWPGHIFVLRKKRINHDSR